MAEDAERVAKLRAALRDYTELMKLPGWVRYLDELKQVVAVAERNLPDTLQKNVDEGKAQAGYIQAARQLLRFADSRVTMLKTQISGLEKGEKHGRNRRHAG